MAVAGLAHLQKWAYHYGHDIKIYKFHLQIPKNASSLFFFCFLFANWGT
jgi:hypothetical protein